MIDQARPTTSMTDEDNSGGHSNKNNEKSSMIERVRSATRTTESRNDGADVKIVTQNNGKKKQGYAIKND